MEKIISPEKTFFCTVARKSNRSLLVTSTLLLIFFFSNSFFTTPLKNPPVRDHYTVDWQLDKTVDGVEFYHAISSCSGKKVVFLKLVNKNSYSVKASWKELFATQFDKELEGYKGKKHLVLSPGETSETSCTTARHKELVVLPSQITPTYEADISSFSFKEISVSKS